MCMCLCGDGWQWASCKQKMMVVMLKVASSDDSTIKIDVKAMLLR